MDLYGGIEKRKSIRKYSDVPVNEDIIKEINKELESASVFFKDSNIRFVLIENTKKAEAKLGFLWGLGKINSPHCIVAVYDGTKEGEANIGFALEPIVIKLSSLGIGTCWLGTFNKEALGKYCKVNENEKIGYVISFGEPVEGFMNNGFRGIAGSTKRKHISEICFYKNFKQSSEVFLSENKNIKKCIDMSIKAPSANNKQPVNIIVDENKAMFFTTQNSYIDVGIFMSHFYLCCKEMEMKPRVIIETEREKDYNKTNENIYVATIIFDMN